MLCFTCETFSVLAVLGILCTRLMGSSYNCHIAFVFKVSLVGNRMQLFTT